MSNNTLLNYKWQTKKLVVCHVLAIALLAAWICPFGYNFFMHIDSAFFSLMNGSLYKSQTWALVWAIMSTRYFDLLVAVIMLLLIACGNWLYESSFARRALFALVAIMILQVIVRVIFTKLINLLGWQHSSPSLVIDGSYHLSEHFLWGDDWDLKDGSRRSFPGDHASVLLIWAFFLSQFARKFWQYSVIWIIAIIFMLPRAVAGAHWASDDYVGGVVLALFALAWGFYTPFAAKVSDFLIKVTAPLFRLLSKIPIINWFSIVRYPK